MWQYLRLDSSVANESQVSDLRMELSAICAEIANQTDGTVTLTSSDENSQPVTSMTATEKVRENDKDKEIVNKNKDDEVVNKDVVITANLWAHILRAVNVLEKSTSDV